MLARPRRRSPITLFHRQFYRGAQFVGLYQTPGASSASQFFQGIPIGKPDPAREVIVIAFGKNGTITPRTVSAISVGSTGAGITGLAIGVVQSGAPTLGGFGMGCARIPVPQPWYTTDLMVQFSGTVADQVAIAVWTVNNRAALNANASDTSSATGASGTSITVNATTIKASGFLVGMGVNGVPAAMTVTGADLLAQLTDGDNQVSAVMTPPQVAAVTPSVVWSWAGAGSLIGSTWAFDFAT